jgi:hypothetical protein
VSKRSLWDGRLYGRNGFDQWTGLEWENGPYFYELGIGPDLPWKLYKPGNKWLWDNASWAVTTFGLEPLGWESSEYELFMIPVEGLLTPHASGQVYFWPITVAEQKRFDIDLFEEAFAEALTIHRKKPEEAMLETTLKRARGMRRRSLRQRVKNLGDSRPHRTTYGIIIPYGWSKS